LSGSPVSDHERRSANWFDVGYKRAFISRRIDQHVPRAATLRCEAAITTFPVLAGDVARFAAQTTTLEPPADWPSIG
jgi:hypothetical protein